ncbi:unnamed protein product [Arctia plantaginis]|uniref:Uncharacterized protein n=1 Tax=Arctia plantaginis TaxID=874455 RepID=A0A8S0ZY78_ARCPL|nr:unnamed protein product [Arctia plantaginis]
MYNIFIKELIQCCFRYVDQIIKNVGNRQPTFTNTVVKVSQQLQPPGTSLKSRSNKEPEATESSEVPVVLDATMFADYDNTEVHSDSEAIESEGTVADNYVTTLSTPSLEVQTLPSEFVDPEVSKAKCKGMMSLYMYSYVQPIAARRAPPLCRSVAQYSEIN